jgi:cobalt-zinc-cadmium efflux system outer membrane protein
VQAGAQVQISRGKAIQAGLSPNPLDGYAAEQIGAAGTAGEFHGIFFEQQIVTGGKLQLSRAKFFQEARQAELQCSRSSTVSCKASESVITTS